MSDTATQFTVPAVADAVAAAIGDRELLIQGDQRYSYAQIVERSNRLAAYLHSRGLGCHTERSALAGHEVGQDLLGLYAYNGNEFVESLLGAFARAWPPSTSTSAMSRTSCSICWPIRARPPWSTTPRSRRGWPKYSPNFRGYAC